MRHKTTTNKLPRVFLRCKGSVCPWRRRRVERLQLWIIIQNGIIIKNHHDELTGTQPAGAHWFPTGGSGSVTPRCVSRFRILPTGVCAQCCVPTVYRYSQYRVFMLQCKRIPHTVQRIDVFVSFPPQTFLHNLSAGWHLTSVPGIWSERDPPKKYFWTCLSTIAEQKQLQSLGDEGNFTRGPGILHLRKSVKVNARCGESTDARGHSKHSSADAEQCRHHTASGNQLHEPRSHKCWGAIWKEQSCTNYQLSGGLLHPDSPSLNVTFSVFSAPVCHQAVYLVTSWTCISGCKSYLRKSSKKNY